MNKLVGIVIRWSKHKVGFHTDVKKINNTIQLREEDWCLQCYIWQSELDSRKLPEEKVIKTLIYGIKSSGNQVQALLKTVAALLNVRELITNTKSSDFNIIVQLP